ncbi:mobilization protein MobC [Stackebrandtia endophytica]|uniref:Mobilization protein MobC n=1 Tax=Stackebrandtia endophytica TaxID=1496996 RepID=A0A543AW72_9ACTN|nr:mobilization protein MobC [Stackebrandtia endophytica]
MKVKFSDAEYALVDQAATEQRMRLATYVAVQALSEHRWTEIDDAGLRPAVVRELMRAHRQVRGIATNINQIAAKANTDHQLPPNLGEVLELVRDTMIRLHLATRQISQSLPVR